MVKRKLLLGLVIAALIGLDQWSKAWIVEHIGLFETRRVLPPIFNLTYLRNYGAAFSILQNQQIFFALMTLLVMAGCVYYLWKHIDGSWWLISALTLIIAGGLGNFIDRIRLGYVVDMIALDFVNFAIFNLADSFLSVGVVLLMIAVWKEEKHGSNR